MLPLPSLPWSSATARTSTSPAIRALCVLAPVLVAACAAEPASTDPADGVGSAKVSAGAPAPAAALAAGLRLHSAKGTGVRFPVPATGVMVEERHFDPSLPTHKFRHSIRLKVDRATFVVIDAWSNPDGLDLETWFHAHLAFLARDNTRVTSRPMARARVAGILLEEPASPQAGSQAIAVFALGDQVFRVTCIDPEGNVAAREVFERVVDQLEAEVTR